MSLNNKSVMWGFNFLVSAGIISILFFGFFMLMGHFGPGELKEVRASVVEVRAGSGLLNFFRVPFENKCLADLVNDLRIIEEGGGSEELVGCNNLNKVLSSFYGDDVAYSLSVDNVKKCVKNKIEDPFVVNLILPYYEGVKNVTLEVSYESLEE